MYSYNQYVAQFNYENIPNNAFVRNFIAEEFVKRRNAAANVFNERIESINQEWAKTGKPASFGDYMEDINPEYVKLIKKSMADALKLINAGHIVRCRIDKYGDIVGYVPFIRNSNVYITLTKRV